MSLDELRCLYEARRLTEAWSLYLNTPIHEAEWHLYGALTAWQRGDQFAGKTAIELALLQRPRGDVKMKCHFTAGIIHRELGVLTKALEHLDACLKGLEQSPTLTPVLKGPALYNKALALENYGRPAEALDFYEKALVEFTREGLVEYRRKCLQNLAWVAGEQGDFLRAWTALDDAAPLLAGPEASQTQQVVKSLLLYLEGERTEALRICEALHREPGAAPAILSLSAVVATEAGLELGLLELAEQMAYVAVEYSCQPPYDHRCFSRASRVSTKVKAARLAKSGIGG